jgi:hypothetical protein
MAGLADDWEENRETCVDVLCGYLRMPYEPDPGQDVQEPQELAFRAVREVRYTVIRVITAHLTRDAAESWRGLNFDFSGVVFDCGDFRGAQFSGVWSTSALPVSTAVASTSVVPASPAAGSASLTPSSLVTRSASTTPTSSGRGRLRTSPILRRHGGLRLRRVLRRPGGLYPRAVLRRPSRLQLC